MQKNSLKVLVVDDETIVQIAHTSMLKSLNCTVEVASDGQQAIDIWKSGFDAIFLDLNMPLKNGIEVTKEIRAISNIDNIPQPIIVCITSDPEMETTCMDVGVNYVLKKPINKEQLEQIIFTIRKEI